MTELTLTEEKNGVTRQFDAWRSNGELYLRLREWFDPDDLAVDTTVTYNLADNGKTVEHDGDYWDEYAKKRFRVLNGKRFR